MTASTSVTVASDQYYSLGAGPIEIQAQSPTVSLRWLVADSQPSPSAPGVELAALQAITINTTSVVWAKTDSGTEIVVVTPMAGVGSTGKDFSANAPTLPNVGAAFAASGPYASYVLVSTVPANSSRACIEIDNLSGSQIAVVRDDGTAANAAAPVNASVFALAGGSGVGAQGGSWSSQTFKGRLQIYAPASTAQVNVMVE